MTQRIVLVTGGTDGIGLELVRAYRDRGARVITVGRRAAAELPIASLKDYCRVDLAQPFASAIVHAFLVQRNIAQLDLLIHCAGIGSYGAPATDTPETIDALLDVNIRTPIALTHALLPQLAAARGRVIFIGSVAAALPVPDYAVYGATKTALEGFARSLQVELQGSVGVQVVHPGATRTAMHAKIGAPLEQMGWKRFPAPAHVAQRIVRAIDTRAPVATIGAGNQLLRFAGRHVGGVVDGLAVRRG